jgi:NAD-dependent dihydropyrimidine dehydrogenase PreA subunit
LPTIIPIFDVARCNGCGLCVAVCRCGALVLKDNVVTIVKVEDCGLCGDCELVCETGALQCPYEIVSEDDR